MPIIAGLSPARPDGRPLRPRPGDVVVLTGTFRTSNDELTARVVAAGLTPEPTLTKRTKLLVAADVDTMSGKAEKARQYGIPIVGEPALLRLLGED